MITKVFLATLLFTSAYCAGWTYKDTHQWKEDFAECAKDAQSPVYIMKNRAVKMQDYSDFTFSESWNRPIPVAELENTGHGYKVTPHVDEALLVNGGGLMASNYSLLQFHIHFGTQTSFHGSEHVLSTKHYPAEIHFVLVNPEKTSSDYGYLAVLGFFIDVQDDYDAPGSLGDYLTGILDMRFNGNARNITDSYRMDQMVPINFPDTMSRFYRYKGSLTTPPCWEVVEWTVFEDPLYISTMQYNFMLGGFSDQNDALIDTWRPTQPLNGRIVYRSPNAGSCDFCDPSTAATATKVSVFTASAAALVAYLSL